MCIEIERATDAAATAAERVVKLRIGAGACLAGPKGYKGKEGMWELGMMEKPLTPHNGPTMTVSSSGALIRGEEIGFPSDSHCDEKKAGESGRKQNGQKPNLRGRLKKVYKI